MNQSTIKPLKVLGIILAILFGIALILVILNLLPFAPGGFPGQNPWRLTPGQRPHIVPHGGAKHLFPENTIYSYEEMYRRGWNTFEVDLVLTHDGILISHHDLDIGRTTGQENDLVRNFTFDQLSRLNFGATFEDLEGNSPYADITWENNPGMAARLIPAKLSQLFQRFGQDSYFILELKDTVQEVGEPWAEQAIQTLVQTIRDYSMEQRVIMASFDSGVINRFRELTNNQVPTGAGTTDVLIFSVLNALGLDFFLPTPYTAMFLPIKDQIYPRERQILESLPGFLRNQLATYDPSTDTLYTNLANRSIIQSSHRKNLAVFYWTVNDPEDMRRMIELGADGIITDRPDLLSDLLVEMGF